LAIPADDFADHSEVPIQDNVDADSIDFVHSRLTLGVHQSFNGQGGYSFTVLGMDYSGVQRKESTPPVRRVVLVLAVLFTLFVAWSVGGQIIWFWLNMEEFGELFVKPVYFEIIGGVILASIAFFRLDLLNRRSLTWWFLHLVASLFKCYGEMEPTRIDFKSFRLSPGRFVIWQLTKVFIGMLIFRNYTFGMAVWAMAQGRDLGLNLVWTVSACLS
jgi:hypothetical protein